MYTLDIEKGGTVVNEFKKSFLEDIDNEKTNLPKEVIILDDVITTGSTLCSCKEILYSLGIEKIHGLSLFIVP